MNAFLYCLAYFGALTFFVVVAFMAGWKAHDEMQKRCIEEGTVVYKGKAGKWIGRLMSLAEIAAQVGDKDESDAAVSR